MPRVAASDAPSGAEEPLEAGGEEDGGEEAGGEEAGGEEAFAHVVSLGSRCVVAATLRSLGLRKYAGPFDWIYSNAEVVQHMLRDDFKAFLCLEKLVEAGKAWGHKTYSRMLNGRSVVFPHHEPAKRDRAHFVRACARLRVVLASPERKLLVIGSQVKSRKELRLVRSQAARGGSRGAVRRLFEDLCRRGVRNFLLVAVQILEGQASKARGAPVVRQMGESGVGRERLILHELSCVGKCTGIYMKEPCDGEALKELITRDRCFRLSPDPMPQGANEGAGKGRRLFGEVGPSEGEGAGDVADALAGRRRKRRRQKPTAGATEEVRARTSCSQGGVPRSKKKARVGAQRGGEAAARPQAPPRRRLRQKQTDLTGAFAAGIARTPSGRFASASAAPRASCLAVIEDSSEDAPEVEHVNEGRALAGACGIFPTLRGSFAVPNREGRVSRLAVIDDSGEDDPEEEDEHGSKDCSEFRSGGVVVLDDDDHQPCVAVVSAASRDESRASGACGFSPCGSDSSDCVEVEDEEEDVGPGQKDEEEEEEEEASEREEEHEPDSARKRSQEDIAEEDGAPVFARIVDMAGSVADEACEDVRRMRSEAAQAHADAEEAAAAAVAAERGAGEDIAVALRASARAFETEARLRLEAQLGRRALAALPASPRQSAKAKRRLLHDLQALGFQDLQAKRAMRRCSSTEACVDWILKQSWE